MTAEGQQRYDFYATTIAFHVALYSGYLWKLYDVLWQSSFSIWRAPIVSKVSIGWLFTAVVIIITEISLHFGSKFTELYIVETVLNVIDLIYFTFVLVATWMTLKSIKGNNVVAIDNSESLSQSQKGTQATGESRHQAQLSASGNKKPPAPSPQIGKHARRVGPSASAPPLTSYVQHSKGNG